MKDRTVKVVLVISVILLLDSCTVGIFTKPLLLLFALTLGWVPFLPRVGQLMPWRWEAAISIAICCGVIMLGGHYFARWLYREMRGSSNNPASPGRWRWAWTLRFFLLFILLFAAGTAAVAMTHQTAWLVRSPEPHFEAARNVRADRVYCSRHLKTIASKLELYADAHDGRLPDDLQQLIEEQDLNPDLLVCTSTPLRGARGATTREVVANATKAEHCSYVYRGKGLVRPISPEFVLVYERSEAHDGEGMNLLFADGNVLWVKKDAIERFLSTPK